MKIIITVDTTGVITNRNIYPVRFFICHGDKYDRCSNCKARFNCYTGELPNRLMELPLVGKTFSSTIEYNLFGNVTGIVEYDYGSHDKHYNKGVILEGSKFG